MAEKSNRSLFYILIALGAGLFFVLYTVLSEGQGTNQPNYIPPSNEEDLNPDEPPRAISQLSSITDRNSSPVSSGGGNSSISFSSVSTAGNSVNFSEKLKQWSRPAKKIPIEKRMAKRRNELKKEGITNEEVLDMLAMELDDKAVMEAIERSEAMANSRDYDGAMKLLKAEAANINPKNILVRMRMYETIARFSIMAGYPDDAKNYALQAMEMSKQETAILLKDKSLEPHNREALEARQKQLNDHTSNPDSIDKIITMLKENKGLPLEAQSSFKAGLLNMSAQAKAAGGGSEVDQSKVKEKFSELNEELSRNWANPK